VPTLHRPDNGTFSLILAGRRDIYHRTALAHRGGFCRPACRERL